MTSVLYQVVQSLLRNAKLLSPNLTQQFTLHAICIPLSLNVVPVDTYLGLFEFLRC